MPKKVASRKHLTRQEKRDLDIEIGFLEGIVHRDPGYVDALQLLGDDYTKRGKYLSGLNIDQKLSGLRPRDPLVFYNLACSLCLTRNFEEAANALEQARIGVRVRLNTNIDPLDLAAGLKSDDTLSLTGIFRLSPLTGILNPQYAIRFADTPGGDVGNHQLLQLQVRTDTTTGLTTVRYLLQDFDANTISVLGDD